MNEDIIRNKIIEIFNSYRDSSEREYDESHFMDFLTEPHSKNTIKNSFKGVKRYYLFMDKLELEFGICFSLSDLDEYYSIDKLTKKVIQRINKGKGNQMILKRRNEQKSKFYFETILIFILIGFIYWQGINWFSIILSCCIIALLYYTLSHKMYEIKQLEKMNKRLQLNK